MDAPPPSLNAAAKLRLMCSYNGHILPRPNSKTLSYLGGETRIVAVDRRATTTLSYLIAHLSKALLQNRPFVLKYQLPNEDLDSLISLLTDEDLLNMLEEHDRIAPPARIRLFLFPAIKFDQDKNSSSGAESLALERSTSFGSTGSSFSTSNSPPVGISEGPIRVPSSASIDSKIAVCQEPLIQLSPEPPSSTLSEADVYASCTPYNLPTQKTTIDQPSYPISQPPNSVQAGLYYPPQYIAPYYSLYQMPAHHSPLNQPYPLYFVPSMPPHQPIDNITAATNRPPLHPQTYVIPQSVLHKEASADQLAESSLAASPSSPVSTASDRDYHLVSEHGNDEEIAYSPIYKTQPSMLPAFSSQYQTMAKGMAVVAAEP